MNVTDIVSSNLSSYVNDYFSGGSITWQSCVEQCHAAAFNYHYGNTIFFLIVAAIFSGISFNLPEEYKEYSKYLMIATFITIICMGLYIKWG